MQRDHDLTSVGPAKCRAHHHLLSFSDQVIGRQMEIGVGAATPDDKAFVVVEGVNVWEVRIMVAEVGGV